MKIRNLFKKNYKIMIGIIIGIIISSVGVYAATTIAGSNITYSNTKSGLSSTDVQAAIDELYEKADAGKVINKTGNFVTAYTYNQTSGASNYCVTGKEATCQKTTCYKTKTTGSCPTGTIIKYKVNDTDIVGFNVLVDEGSTMIMQSQGNIVNNTVWGPQPNTSGPITILTALENATNNWSNVNNQTYSIGDSSSILGYSGCNAYNSCTATTYPKLEKRSVKARMITLQEAVNYGGCTTFSSSSVSCKKFMTTNRKDVYWTMSASSNDSYNAWFVHFEGYVSYHDLNYTNGSGAVVEVNK